MKGSNFLKENNARFLWHPMTSPEDSHTVPPKIITESGGVCIQDIDGHRVVEETALRLARQYHKLRGELVTATPIRAIR